MRPPGPEPWSSRRSTPVWAAIFFASGEAFTRPPDGCAATAAAGALVTGDGRIGTRATAGGRGGAAGRRAPVGRAGGAGGGAGGAAGARRGGGAGAGGAGPSLPP